MYKVLVYGINFYPELTGIGKYTGEMAEWLSNHGYHIDVVTGMPYYPDWVVGESYRHKKFFRERIGGVNVQRVPLFVPTVNRLNSRMRILHELSFMFNSLYYWSAILCSRTKYDAVITIAPPFQTAIMPMLYGWIRGVPWFYHVQDLQVDAAIGLGLLPKAFSKMLFHLESILLKNATRVSTITRAMKSRIRDKGVLAKNILLFPNWSGSNVAPVDKDNGFRREIGAKPSDIVLMYAGNMGEKQGLDLITSAAESLKGYTNLKFVLVGNGASEMRLKSKVQNIGLENVSFYPLQPTERLPEVLGAADIHLVVQRRGAADLVMPSKLTNIMAAARPAIVTADMGTSLEEVISGGRTGLAVPPEDIDSFVEAILTLSQDDTLREELSRNAREYSEQYLRKEAILGRFAEQLSEVIKSRERESLV